MRKEIKETVDARKVQLGEKQVWDLLRNAREIVIGQGKNYIAFVPSESKRNDILRHCLGRTGNLRAPALRIGSRYIIGFNDDMYRKYVA